MEGTLINWLNSVFPGLGVFLAVTIAGGGLIVGGAKQVNKVVKSRDAKLRKKEEQEESDREFREQMMNLVHNVNDINERVTKMDANQCLHNESVDRKLEEFGKAIQDERVNSRKGDDDLSTRMSMYEQQTGEICKKLDNMTDSMNLIIESDKEGIKSFITSEYYKAVDKGYVEMFTLQALESRYTAYLREHGDSFVESLMDELRVMEKRR